MHGLKISLDQLPLLRANEKKKYEMTYRLRQGEEAKQQRLLALNNGISCKILLGKFSLLKTYFRTSSVKKKAPSWSSGALSSSPVSFPVHTQEVHCHS